MSIDIKQLHIGQKIWVDGEEKKITALDSERGHCVRTGTFEWWLPSQISLTPPKRKERRTMDTWINVYHNKDRDVIHNMRAGADICARPDRLACIPVTVNYEVETE